MSREAYWNVQAVSDRRGRGVVASQDIALGFPVLDENAWAVALSRHEVASRCDFSLREVKDCASHVLCNDTGLLFGSGADRDRAAVEYYQCERAAAIAPQSLGPHGKGGIPRVQEMPSSLRLALRVLWRGIAHGSAPWNELQSHWESLDAEQEKKFHMQAVVLAEHLRKGLASKGQEGSAVDVDTIARLIAAVDVNAMVVTDHEQRGIGVGLFQLGAFFNHDENPNCVQSFHGRRLLIRTVRSIKAGEELTIAYSELAELSSVRRAKLRAQYMFDPVARGQSLPKPTSQRDNLLTEVQSIGENGTWLPCLQGFQWSYDGGVHLSGDRMNSEVAAMANRIHDEWTKAKSELDTSSDAGVKSATRHLRKAWSLASADTVRLGDCHALRLQVARDGMDAAISAERWGDAVIFARAVAAMNQQLYPPSWPVTGMSYARLAKLELYHCRFGAAAQAGEEALRILSISCDDSLEIFEEVRQITAQAKAEMQAAQASGFPMLGKPAQLALPVAAQSSDAQLTDLNGAQALAQSLTAQFADLDTMD